VTGVADTMEEFSLLGSILESSEREDFLASQQT
jgi:hypothetical protein